MKKILSSEVNKYISDGFIEAQIIRGTDGTRTYRVLTKKNDLHVRIKFFFTVLVKILFSCGAVLKDKKILDKWHFALSKKTVFEIIQLERPDVGTTEFCQEMIEPLSRKSQKKSLHIHRPFFEIPSLVTLCIQAAAQIYNLKPQLLPINLANKVLAESTKQNTLSLSVLESVFLANELETYLNIPSTQFKQILDQCPNLTTFKFNSFAPCSLDNFNANVDLLVKDKEKQQNLPIILYVEYLNEDFFIKIFSILNKTSLTFFFETKHFDEKFFIDFFTSDSKLDINKKKLWNQLITSFSDLEIYHLTVWIFSNQLIWKDKKLDCIHVLMTFIEFLNRYESLVNVIFNQKDVVTILQKLLKKICSLKLDDQTHIPKFFQVAFSKLSDEQFEKLFILMLNDEREEIKEELLKNFLNFSLINCPHDVVLKRMEIVLKGEEQQFLVKSIIEQLKIEYGDQSVSLQKTD